MINIFEESTINFWIWRLRNQRKTTKDKDHKSSVEKNFELFCLSNLSAGKMKEFQAQDIVLSQIIDYLENDNLPES